MNFKKKNAHVPLKRDGVHPAAAAAAAAAEWPHAREHPSLTCMHCPRSHAYSSSTSAVTWFRFVHSECADYIHVGVAVLLLILISRSVRRIELARWELIMGLAN